MTTTSRRSAPRISEGSGAHDRPTGLTGDGRPDNAGGWERRCRPVGSARAAWRWLEDPDPGQPPFLREVTELTRCSAGTCPATTRRLFSTAMLSVDIRSLDGRAVELEGSIDPEDAVWLDGDIRPSSPVTVHGRLSSAGEGRYYFTGEFRGTAFGECTRCLTEVSVRAGDSMQCLFVESGEDGLDDDPDVFLLDGKSSSIDLRPAVREGWLLAAPTFVLCREDCKGLCPTCGGDRNTAACSCASDGDARWAALHERPTEP